MLISLAALALALWSIPLHVPPHTAGQMRAWYAANDTCRQRDVVQRRLARQGWSWSSARGWERRDR